MREFRDDFKAKGKAAVHAALAKQPFRATPSFADLEAVVDALLEFFVDYEPPAPVAAPAPLPEPEPVAAAPVSVPETVAPAVDTPAAPATPPAEPAEPAAEVAAPAPAEGAAGYGPDVDPADEPDDKPTEDVV